MKKKICKVCHHGRELEKEGVCKECVLLLKRQKEQMIRTTEANKQMVR